MHVDKTNRKTTLVTSIFGLLFGTLSVAFAIAIYAITAGSIGYYTATWYTYGADYYTDTYQAVANIANYLDTLLGIIGFAFGTLLLVLGGWILMHYIVKLSATFKNDDSGKQGTSAQNTAPATGETINDIKQLFEMKEAGILTEEDFEMKKNKFLEKL